MIRPLTRYMYVVLAQVNLHVPDTRRDASLAELYRRSRNGPTNYAVTVDVRSSRHWLTNQPTTSATSRVAYRWQRADPSSQVSAEYM